MITAFLILTACALVLGAFLTLAASRLATERDGRRDQIASALPQTNCGACGFATCALFCKALLAGKADPAGCIPGGSETAYKISNIFGVALKKDEARMAVIHCKGGNAEALRRNEYRGIPDCHAAVLAGNGTRLCTEGCLGLGTCVRACPTNAITITANGVAVVNQELCTGCGCCIATCPRKIIELIPRHFKIFLSCANHLPEARVREMCTVGCTACERCVEKTPSGAITMERNLPRLNYSREENFVVAHYSCPLHCFTDLAGARPKANITMACDGCGACVLSCPVDSIAGEKGIRHIINKETCIGCGLCAEVCPKKAISIIGGLGHRGTTLMSKRQRSRLA